MCRGLNYFEHFLVFISAINGCVSISVFVSLVEVLVCITSSAVGLKICESLQELKSLSQLSKTRGKKHEKVLLGKAELDTMEVNRLNRFIYKSFWTFLTLNFLLIVCCSLLFACWSLLFPRCLWLFDCYSLLFVCFLLRSAQLLWAIARRLIILVTIIYLVD